MDKNLGFGLLAVLTAAMLIVGPVRHLWSGVVEYKRITYPNGRRLLRRDDPTKFYLYVATETGLLIFLLALAYWVIFRTDAPR